jgi:hypothetical protein
MTVYYVSSISGSNNNAGTSATAPLATLQAAADLVQPGDTVQVMNGTYSNPSGDGAVLQITTSGTASAPITFEAMPGQTPVIESAGNWAGIGDYGASYITVSGFTIQGDAPSVTLAEAQSQENNTNNPVTAGDGIDIESGSGGSNPHNIIIEDNTVHDQPGGGIVSMDADYVQILNNITYDNAKYSPYASSGISLGFSQNYNTAPGVHDIVSGNTSYDNTELIPFHVTGTITDGEGIIIDSNNLNDYSGAILVENNTAYGNSGPGIEDFNSNNVTITGNSSYGNTTNARLANEGQISISESTGSTSTGNSTSAPASTPPAGSSGDAPAITLTVPTTAVSDTLGTAAAIPGVSVSDTSSSDAISLAVKASSGDLSMTGATGSGTGTLTISGAAATLNTDLATLKFTGTAAGSATVSVAASDSAGATPANASFGVSVSPAEVTTDTLVLLLSQSRASSGLKFIVDVNGTQVGSGTVTAQHSLGQTQAFDFSGNWGTGALSVVLQDMSWGDGRPGSGGAPALYVQQETLNGTTGLTGSIVLGSHQSTTHVFG